MKRYIGSLLLAMVFALGLLPVTALAAPAEGAPSELYVGNYQITSSDTTTYLKAGLKEGSLTEGSETDWTVKYDPSTATLTLNGATIQGGTSTGSVPYGSGIYALSRSGQPVSLTIKLIGTNTITGNYGIYVDAQQGETVGTNASLLIRNSSNNGRLEVSGSSHGIYVKSGTGDASLNINDASVVAKTTQTSSGYAGVCVQSGSDATSSPKLSLAVDGGSLTTSGGTSSDGIQFYVGANKATSATTSLTVTDNAIVDAKNGGISAKQISNPINTDINATGKTGGMVFDGAEGTVYGNVTLDENLTIGKDETLTIGKGASLTVPEGKKLTNDGTVNVQAGGTLTGKPEGSGAVNYASTQITAQPGKADVKEGEKATFTLTATGSGKLTYQWQKSLDNGGNWADIEGATNATYTIQQATMEMSGIQYRCVVKGDGGEATSDVVVLTVQHQHTLVKTEAKPATCTDKGNQEYWYCDGCKKYFADDKGMTETTLEKQEIPATGHSWGEPVWNWSENGKNCTVTFTCTKDQSHTVSPTVKITSAVKTPATCQAKGVTTYTATAELDGKTYTSTKDVTDIPLGDHVAKWEGDYPATCDTNGREGTATCVVCGKVLVKDKVIPAPGHKYGEPVWTWSKDGKSCTVTFTCSVCGEKSENKATVTTKASTEATCTQPGTATQQAQVVFNGNTYTTTKGNVTLSALGHNYKDGKCTRCGQADPDAKPTATASVTTGANGKWQTDSTQGLSFTYAGDGKFLRVQVNGTTLKEGQYQQQGNTVTLTQEYLKTLDPGSYTLVIALENSSAKTTFTVEQPAQATPVPTPQPTQQPEDKEDSEKSGNLLWIALGGGAAVLLIGGVAFLRFKRSLYD